MAAWTLVGLRVLREVGAHGSFTAAAEVLGYTQSAVSRQVAAMERVAEAPLFERQARGVRPTAAGRVLLRHAEVVLERADAATLELRGLQDRLEGRLAVGAFPTALGVLVPRAVALLSREHPGVLVTLREGSTPTHLRRVRAGRLEVGVVALDADELDAASDLRCDLLVRGRTLVAVAATHRLAGRATVSPDELEDEPWIAGAGGAGEPSFTVWPGLRGTPRVAFAVRDWPGRLGLVAAGLGIAVVPSLAAAAVPRGVELVEVDGTVEGRRLAYAATARDRSPGADALVRALRTVGAGLSVRPATD
ncbi:LysR family transcriptional regulator [Patulibacter sp.]|uniref:LysR family transcriptional regulator n=1 Tax=Patulibacter sp. TaxID=1912859 RepID=UPI0027229BA1|nr:LysR substrate-binding domain-containing protein [Patulibacter sp.]MDO9407021.1 LysR substrate-binding domain-containing protein [Patulibacter sp.]